MLEKKLEQLHNNNILIPKEGKDDEEIERDEENQKQQFITNIQEEVRKLHYQLQAKDQVINQLKQYISKNQGEDLD